MAALHGATGDDALAGFQVVGHLLPGWPLYLLQNDTGGRQNFDGSHKRGNGTLGHLRPPSKLGTKIAIR